jgi:mannose-6-phosphate isomerase
MQELIRFKPLYQERVWGGRALAGTFGRRIPASRPIGESWEIVDRPEAQSVVVGGPMDGKTLRAALEADPAGIMGPAWPAARPFPLLVKWLDCSERLSLQVHPPASVAAELRGEPKTENWYIARAEPGAQVMVGLKRGVTRGQFEQAMAAQSLESCVHSFPVSAGDSILVHSGEVHAIDAGNLILEIQQNSDTTYRVYDWGRVGLDGRPRQLHIAESLRSIRWDDFEPAPVRASATSAVIADCPEFRIRRLYLAAGEGLRLAAHVEPRLLSVASGAVKVSAGEGDAQALVQGDNVLLPFAGTFTIAADETSILLLTEHFA